MSAKTYLASAIALLALAVPATAGAVENGPDPTFESVRAASGPYEVNRAVVSDANTPGFGAAAVWWPKNAEGQKFGAIAIAPGFTETTSAISWLGPKLASNGFVVITHNVNNTFTDLPDSRGVQLNAALRYLQNTSVAKDFVDPERLGVSGHSMGGGATLEAARRNSGIKAIVGLEPWNVTTSWKDITAASLMIGAQNDFIAPPAYHAVKFYNSIPNTTAKGYFQIAGADHFVSNAPNVNVGSATLSWFKRYLDGDTRYGALLAPKLVGPNTNQLQLWATKNVS